MHIYFTKTVVCSSDIDKLFNKTQNRLRHNSNAKEERPIRLEIWMHATKYSPCINLIYTLHTVCFMYGLSI